MQVTWTELTIPGLLLSLGASVSDERGSFTKVLSGGDPVLGVFEGREIYWTQSVRGVLRGMHFQLPPEATSKLVFVVSGEIRDFILDLRVGSPTERHLVEVRLNAADGALLVPKGCAHAYEALEDNTIVFWCTDNGAERRRPWRGSAGPWNGFYNSAMEGGIRTPCVIRWPGRIPAGQVSNEIVHQVDFFPTLAAAVGAPEIVPDDRAIGKTLLT